jgi:hypothetical protein
MKTTITFLTDSGVNPALPFFASSWPEYTADFSDISSDSDNISDISSATAGESGSSSDADSEELEDFDDITDSDDSAADAAMDDSDDEGDYTYSDDDISSVDSDYANDSEAEHADDERDVCHWTVFTENLVGNPELVRDWLLAMKDNRPATFTKVTTLLTSQLHDKYPHKAMFVALLH